MNILWNLAYLDYTEGIKRVTLGLLSTRDMM
jgi:hypothetical protein